MDQDLIQFIIDRFLEYGTYGLIILGLALLATTIISLTFLFYLRKKYGSKDL